MVRDGADEEEAYRAVAAAAGASVAEVRSCRERAAALATELEAWLADQIMRGPGRARGGGSTDRLGKPCPMPLAEYYWCQRFGFQVMPRDLIEGHVDDQPADTYLLYANLLSKEAEMRERLEFLQQKKTGGKRR